MTQQMTKVDALRHVLRSAKNARLAEDRQLREQIDALQEQRQQLSRELAAMPYDEDIEERPYAELASIAEDAAGRGLDVPDVLFMETDDDAGTELVNIEDLKEYL